MTTSELEGYAEFAGRALSNFQLGMMQMMQNDPEDTTTLCYQNTIVTNTYIMDIADFTAYTTGGFDTGTFLIKFKEMNFFLIQELEACSYNEFLISLDSMLSNIPAAVAAGLNIATQAGTGF